MRYEVPDRYIRRECARTLQGPETNLVSATTRGTRDSDLNLRATNHPEFDAWRWNDYWVPLEVVIEFKRGVYELALTELSRFMPRAVSHNRFLRSGMRGPRGDDDTPVVDPDMPPPRDPEEFL